MENKTVNQPPPAPPIVDHPVPQTEDWDKEMRRESRPSGALNFHGYLGQFMFFRDNFPPAPKKKLRQRHKAQSQ